MKRSFLMICVVAMLSVGATSVFAEMISVGSVGIYEGSRSVCSIEKNVHTGDFAYVAAREGGLQVLDVSDPTHPFVISSLSGEAIGRSRVIDVAVIGKYAYIACYKDTWSPSTSDNSGLKVIDISNPYSPFQVGFVESDGPRVNFMSTPKNLVVRDQYVYMTADGSFFDDTDIYVINISNPSSPAIVGQEALGSSLYSDIVLAGENAYVCRTANGNVTGMTAFDISNPSSPTAIGSVKTGTMGPPDIAIKGNYVYTIHNSRVTGRAYLNVTDVSNPASPEEVASLTLQEYGDARGIAIKANCAYVVADYSSVEKVDISDPLAPLTVEYLRISSSSIDNREIEIYGDYAYISQSSSVEIIELGCAQDSDCGDNPFLNRCYNNVCQTCVKVIYSSAGTPVGCAEWSD